MLEKIKSNKGLRKLIAISLVITMTLANVMLLGKHLITYAFEENLENQVTTTQDPNVRFDAYFVNDGGEISHSAIFDATNDSNKINLALSVRNAGYLKEAYVEFRDQFFGQDTNYQIPNEIDNSSLIENVNSNLKTISLKRIEAGTDAVIEVPVSLDVTEMMNKDNLRKNTYVQFRGIYVNEKGNQVEVSKIIRLDLGWTLNKDIVLEQAISKFVPSENGTLLQIKASVKQDSTSFALPVKSTELKIKVPELAETMPEKISVAVNDTMATNGNRIEFTSDNWEYNEEDRTITISTSGYEEEAYAWSGIGTDEYFVTFVYPVNLTGVETVISCDTQVTMKVYSPEGIEDKTASSVSDITLTEQYGDVVTYFVKANQDELSKGRIYANLNSDAKTYETEYSAKIRANVSDFENIDELYINLNSDEFVTESTALSDAGYTNYKQIRINKSKMERLLGEEGFVNIFVDGDQYTFNRDSEDENGDYILNIEANIVYVQTSKPITDGIFEVNVIKAISKDLPYSKVQAQAFRELKLNVAGEYRKINTTDYIPANVNDTIALKETTTRANLELNNTNLSAMVENKNVEIKIVLNNNEENSDLYNAPVFRIQMPEYIEDIEITGGNILYSNGLEFDYVEKDMENKVITIHTKGAETAFSDGVFTNGANIILNANIKVSKLSPNTTDKFVMTYVNSSAVAYANNATDEVAVNIVAPQEMVVYNSVLARGLQATSQDGSEQAIKLDILDSSKIATMKMTILNKYSSACNNVKILGRTPFEGNTSIKEGNDLGTTFDAKMISAIDTADTNAIVYYSANENATADLEDTTNEWSRDFASVSEVKSYLIILEDYDMQPGESLEFSYNCQIPENLEHNESAFGTYVVYFDNASEYTVSSEIEATRVGLTTGIGSNIEMTTKVLYNGNEITDEDSVKEYQTVTYRTTIRNTGSIDVENATLVINVENGELISTEEGRTNVKRRTVSIENIPAGEEVEYEYEVTVHSIYDILKDKHDEAFANMIKSSNYANIENLSDELKLKNTVNLTAQNFESSLEDEYENLIGISKIKFSISMEKGTIESDTDDVLTISVENLSNENIDNIRFVQKFSEYIDIESSGNNITYNSNKELQVNLDSLGKNEKRNINVLIKSNLPGNIGKEIVSGRMFAYINNEEYTSLNNLIITLVGPVLQVNIDSSAATGSYIKENQELTITGNIKNIGEVAAKNAKIYIDLPEDFKVSTYSCIKNNGDSLNLRGSRSNKYSATTNIEKNDIINFEITGHFELPYNVEQAEVEFIANINNKVNSNKLSYTVEDVPNSNGGNNGENNGGNTTPRTQTYKISGLAWLDENEDGKKQDSEKLLQGINVLLIDANTGVIVTDRTNGTAKETKTNTSGKYTFTNLLPGQYLVVFEYDTGRYNVTEYNKNGVSADLASKAIQTRINKDGTIKYAGITDRISITNSSIANLNIGLVEKEKFDLSLDKQIDMVVISNSGGTKTYTFDNPKLGKIDIQGKYLNSTTAAIQYKLVVKNEGQIAGYAKKIIDYISNDLEFDINENPGWYVGTDGNLYNNALADELIKPGESKEITLLVYKQMNGENTGLITNRAEIYEDYNDLGYEDYNSKPANKSQTENDFSSADVIITVRTGSTVLYITIAIVSIAIIATGAYMINKKVLKGGRR